VSLAGLYCFPSESCCFIRDPRTVPLIDFDTAPLTSKSSPLLYDASLPITTANGTNVIASLEIPPGVIGKQDDLIPRVLDPICTPVKQVVLGSLTWLAADGSRCDPAKQPPDLPCNSNGMWPYRATAGNLPRRTAHGEGTETRDDR
jgi:hypothetical protein